MNNIKTLFNTIKGNNFWKNLFKNSFYAVVGEGGASAINLIIMVLLIKLMGNEGYATLILAQSYMLILDTIINMQCWKGVIKFGEEAKATKNDEEFNGYLKLGAILDISTAVLGCIISFILSSILGNALGWSETLITSAQIFSIVILFHFSGTPTAILRMNDKFNWVAVQKIISALLKMLAIIVILIFIKKISVITGVIIYALTDIIGHLILIGMSLVIVHKDMGIKTVIKSKLPIKSKEFTKFTIWTTLSDVVDVPVQYFDVFIISKLNLSLVAIFKVFKQLISIISKLTTPLYQAIYPQFSKLVANNQKTEGYNVVLKVRKTVIKFFLPVSIIIGLTSYWWLQLIFDINYANYWYVLCIYLVSHTFALSYTTIHPYFVSIGKVLDSFIICMISNIVYIIIAYSLVNILGMIGLIFAYVVQFSIVIFAKKIIIERSLENDKA